MRGPPVLAIGVPLQEFSCPVLQLPNRSGSSKGFLCLGACHGGSPAASYSTSSRCGRACDPPVVNPVVCENSKPGSPPHRSGTSLEPGDDSIQGFSTEISVNAGQPIRFKVATNAPSYTIAIYRTAGTAATERARSRMLCHRSCARTNLPAGATSPRSCTTAARGGVCRQRGKYRQQQYPVFTLPC